MEQDNKLAQKLQKADYELQEATQAVSDEAKIEFAVAEEELTDMAQTMGAEGKKMLREGDNAIGELMEDLAEEGQKLGDKIKKAFKDK